MNSFQYTRVSTPKAAITAYTQDNGTYFLAGGTNLIDLMKREVVIPERLVELAVPGWPQRVAVDVVWSRRRPLGPAGNWLRERLLRPS